MSELETGTKPSKYTLATRETLIKIADDRDELKRLFKLCVKDLYSSSVKFKKNTALEIFKHINKPSEQSEDWYE